MGHRNTEDTEKSSVHSVLQWLKKGVGTTDGLEGPVNEFRPPVWGWEANNAKR